MSIRGDLYSRGFYFLSDKSSFGYLSACLADGLSQLGFPVYSNVCCDEPLVTGFKCEVAQEIKPKDAACVVLDLQDTYGDYGNRVVEIERLNERMVVICWQDNAGDFTLAEGMPLLCTHENRFRKVAGVRIPAGFGISSSMIEASVRYGTDGSRNRSFLCNFRPSLRQDVRASLDLSFIPELERHYRIDDRIVGNGRWSPEYFELLSKTFGCLAYGGSFIQNLMRNDFFRQSEQLREFGDLVSWGHNTVIGRWDSWRFWESLLFGCVTVHLDFDRYGFSLPVMPENWKHYVGLNLSDIRRDVERLNDERDKLPEIALAGRQWALQHYSPVAVARRFISMLQSGFTVVEEGGFYVLG